MNRRLAVLACLVVAFMAVLGVHPDIAAAHGDGGSMTVLTAEQDGPLAIHLVVGIVYGNDGDPATGATVSVTGTGPDGANLAETRLNREQGAKYGATVDVAAEGTWRLTITSSAPEATATATVEVTEQRPTTEPATTTPGTSGPSGTSASTVSAASIAPQTTNTPEQPSAVADTDDSSDLGLIALAGGVVVVLLVGVVLYLRSKRSRQTDSHLE